MNALETPWISRGNVVIVLGNAGVVQRPRQKVAREISWAELTGREEFLLLGLVKGQCPRENSPVPIET